MGRGQSTEAKSEDQVTDKKSKDTETMIPETMLEGLDKLEVKHVTDLEVDVGGTKLKIAYREAKALGSPKFDVLFLHGQAFKSETWVSEPVYTVQLLSKLGFRAVAVDLPGYGDSPMAVVDNAAFLEAFISAVKLDKPVIISPSMSGSFSLPFLFKDPDNVQSKVRGFVPVAPLGTEAYADNFSKLKVQTMFIYGSNDKKIGPASLKNFEDLPNKETVELKDAGHACYMNKPKEFNQHLYTFLLSLRK